MAGRSIPSWAAGDQLSAPFALRPLHGALVAFVLTLPAYTPTLSYFSAAPQTAALSDAFLFALLLGTLLAAVLMTVRGLQTPPQVSRGGILLKIASVAYLGGIALFLGLLFQEQPVPLLATAAGFVAGAALPVLVAVWTRIVAVPMERALLLCGFVGVTVSFMGWVLSLLPIHLLVPAYVVLLLAGVVPLWASARTRSADEDLDETAPRGALRGLLSVTWLPLLGLAVFAFMTTVMAHSAFGVVQATFLSGVLAAVVVFGVCFLWGRKPLLPWCYRVLVPVLGAVFVVLGAFPGDTFPREVSVVALYLFYLVLAMLGCALFLAVVHVRELSSRVAVGFGVSVAALAALLGCILSQVLQVTADFSPWLTVLTGAFIAVLLVFLGRTAWDELGELQEARVAATAEVSEGALVADSILADLPVRVPLEARCAALAEQFGLSPREAEILVYLARGFSPTYIAKDLVLSVSTVRTHVRNIYRKLGIGKREELIHLVDEE